MVSYSRKRRGGGLCGSKGCKTMNQRNKNKSFSQVNPMRASMGAKPPNVPKEEGKENEFPPVGRFN